MFWQGASGLPRLEEVPRFKVLQEGPLHRPAWRSGPPRGAKMARKRQEGPKCAENLSEKCKFWQEWLKLTEKNAKMVLFQAAEP